MEWINVEKEKPKDKKHFLGTDGEIVFVAHWCDDNESYKVGGW